MKKEIREALGKKWIYIKTKNFIRFIRPLNRKISLKEIKRNDEDLEKFCKIFGIPKSRKISFFSVKDRKEMKEFVGRETNGHADSEKFRVFSVHICDIHEPVHVLSSNYLVGPNNLLGEGLAVCAGKNGKWHGKSLGYWMKKFLKEKRYITLKELMDDFKFVMKEYDDNITYPESGAFVKFLIDKFGIEKFKELYARVLWKRPIDENIKLFEKILKIKFEDLENKFILYYSKKRG